MANCKSGYRARFVKFVSEYGSRLVKTPEQIQLVAEELNDMLEEFFQLYGHDDDLAATAMLMQTFWRDVRTNFDAELFAKIDQDDVEPLLDTIRRMGHALECFGEGTDGVVMDEMDMLDHDNWAKICWPVLNQPAVHYLIRVQWMNSKPQVM